MWYEMTRTKKRGRDVLVRNGSPGDGLGDHLLHPYESIDPLIYLTYYSTMLNTFRFQFAY